MAEIVGHSITTVQAAKAALTSSRLVFGNPLQLEAVRLLGAVEECKAAIAQCVAAGHPQKRDCENCAGTSLCLGRCAYCDAQCCATCSECHGAGEIDGCPECLAAFSEMVQNAARSEV